MSEFAIEVEGGKSVRLKTAGKYCDRNIVVTATGGGGDTDAAYQQGVVDGKQAEYDRFWDAYQNSGGYVYSYAGAFGSRQWTDEVYNPKYPIVCGGGYNMERLFYLAEITDTKVTITALNGDFITQMFSNATKLKTIRKLLLGRTEGVRMLNSFDSCVALENITIEGILCGQSGRTDPNFQWSPLTKASIKNIISCLSDTQTDAVTAAFSLSAVNTAFETSEGAADGSTSAEWLALVDTKSNWTISLV